MQSESSESGTREKVKLSSGEARSAENRCQPTGFWELLDGLLRRREAYFEQVFAGQDVGALLRRFLAASVVLSAFYGLTMGASALTLDWQRGVYQMISSACKVPLLYLLSLAVCYPVLFVVVVLMGSRLSFQQTLALVLLALGCNSLLLASCAPIVVFFVITGTDYHFVKLLHVAIFGFGGAWGMVALLQGLRAMCEKSQLYPRQAIRILKVWILIFGFVGTQMAWTLRPFVGSPDQAFQVFRSSQQGNFYRAVWQAAAQLVKED